MNNLHRRISIRVQLLLLVLAVALPAAALLAWHLADDARHARESAYARVALIAAEVAADLELTLRDQEEQLSLVAAEFRGNPPRRSQRFDPAQFMRNRPQLTNLGVRDLRANNIYLHWPNPTPPAEAVQFPWVAQGQSSESFAVGDAFLGRLSGRWVMVLTHPVRDEQGKRSGFVDLSLDLLTVNERVFGAVPRKAVVIVSDRGDRFLLHSVDAASWIGKPLPAAQAEALRGWRDGFFSARGVDGTPHLYAGVTMARTGWRVFAGVAEDEVFAGYRELLARSIAIGLVALALVLALAVWISLIIARPIGELAGTATRIAGGDSAARARILGPPEIQRVAQQFNNMLDTLARQREERAALIGHMEKLFQLARDVILLIDPEGRVVEANDAAVAAYGYGADELHGMHVRMLRAERTRADVERDWQASADPKGVLFETVHRRKDGSLFPVEVSARSIDIEGRLYRQSFIRDISDRRAAEAQILRLNRAYATLSETNQAIVRVTDTQDLFTNLCRIAVDFGGYVGAWVGLVDTQSGSVTVAAIGGKVEDYVRQIRVSADAGQPEGRGPVACAIREGRPYYCQDFLTDPATEPWRDLAPAFGIRSVAALPLRRGGAVIGTFNLYSAEAEVFDAPTRSLLEEMATDISFAVDNLDRDTARRQAEAKLARSEAFYRGLFRNMREGLAYCRLITENGRPRDFAYLSVNEAFEELTGLTGAVGRNVSELIPGVRESNPELFEIYGRVAATGNPESFESYVPPLHRWFSVSAYCPEPGHFIAVFDNITERKRTEQALREGEERFRSMLEQNISAVFMIENGLLTYANRRAGEVLGYPTQELMGKPVLDLVVEADRPGVIEASRQLLSGNWRTAEQDFRVLRKDGTVGDVGGHATVATLNGKKAIIGIAQDIGERRKAQAEIERYIVRLEHSMESTLQAVSGMVELRDPYTAGHERRVGELAAAIGAEMGLPEARVKGLRLAGYVHDIGKISVPAEILSKPSRLTPMEFELIKEHSQSGYDVLKDVDFPWPVAEIILQHHERLDGSGYPRQLKDGEIIMEARVIAVADVVEAMSSHRPYRPGLGIEAALEEIARNSGKIYDAQVAAACLRLFRDRGYALTD